MIFQSISEKTCAKSIALKFACRRYFSLLKTILTLQNYFNNIIIYINISSKNMKNVIKILIF